METLVEEFKLGTAKLMSRFVFPDGCSGIRGGIGIGIG